MITNSVTSNCANILLTVLDIWYFGLLSPKSVPLDWNSSPSELFRSMFSKAESVPFPFPASRGAYVPWPMAQSSTIKAANLQISPFSPFPLLHYFLWFVLLLPSYKNPGNCTEPTWTIQDNLSISRHLA